MAKPRHRVDLFGAGPCLNEQRHCRLDPVEFTGNKPQVLQAIVFLRKPQHGLYEKMECKILNQCKTASPSRIYIAVGVIIIMVIVYMTSNSGELYYML